MIVKDRVDRIIELHGQLVATVKTTFDQAIEIGQLLIEQKAELPHGQWGEWVNENLPFTVRTASSYMKVYRNRNHLKSETVSDLTSAYRLLESPAKATKQANARDDSEQQHDANGVEVIEESASGDLTDMDKAGVQAVASGGADDEDEGANQDGINSGEPVAVDTAEVEDVQGDSDEDVQYDGDEDIQSDVNRATADDTIVDTEFEDVDPVETGPEVEDVQYDDDTGDNAYDLEFLAYQVDLALQRCRREIESLLEDSEGGFANLPGGVTCDNLLLQIESMSSLLGKLTSLVDDEEES